MLLAQTFADILSTSPDKMPCRSSSQLSVLSSNVVAASSRTAISCSLFSMLFLSWLQ